MIFKIPKPNNIIIALIPGFAFSIVAFFIFGEQIYRGLDGSNWIRLGWYLKPLEPIYPGFTLDHLQGCSSIQFPVKFNYSLTFQVAGWLPFSKKAAVYWASVFIIAFFSLLIGQNVGFGKIQMAFLFFFNICALLPIPAGFYGLAGCAPVFPEVSMLTSLCTIFMFKKSEKAQLLKTTVIYITFIYFGLVYPAALILLMPQLLIWAGIASNRLFTFIKTPRLKNITQKNWEINFHLFYGLFLLLISLWVYLHLKNSAFSFFSIEIVEKINLSDVSLIFWNPRSIIAVIFILLGIVCAFFSLYGNTDKDRLWLMLSALILILGLVQVIMFLCIKIHLNLTRGFAPIYTEYIFYPLYFCLIIFISTKKCSNLPRLLKNSALSLLAIFLIMSFSKHAFNKVTNLGTDYFECPEKNQIINILRESIFENSTNNTFKGRCESFIGLGIPKQNHYDWMEFHAFQGLCNEVFKNDFRTCGLWNFGIPTLFQYSHLRDPFLHKYTKHFFARPSDSVWKNVPVYTKINLNALGLLGVRFVITDSKIIGENVELQAFIPWPNEKDKLKNLWWPHPDRENPWIGIRGIYLYELKKVNLGTQSPILVLSDQNDADTVLKTLASKNYFKGEKPIAVHSEQNLVAPAEATDVKLLYSPHGFTVSAKSNGRSGLLLPFTFSNCLKYTPATNMSKNESVKLYRANLAQTLLIFDKEINGEIKYISTPFYNPQDIWKDVLDGKHAFNK